MNILLQRPIKPSAAASFATPEPAQLHSIDYFVRIPAWSVFKAEWQHLDTNLDDYGMDVDPALRDTDTVVVSGSAEWQAAYQTRVLSMSWDWIVAEDGAVYTSAVTLPRTNIMVVDASGYDSGEIGTAIVLWKAVELLPWRLHIKRLLARGMHGRSRADQLH